MPLCSIADRRSLSGNILQECTTRAAPKQSLVSWTTSRPDIFHEGGRVPNEENQQPRDNGARDRHLLTPHGTPRCKDVKDIKPLFTARFDMQRLAGRAKTGKLSTPKATGRCVCGDVKFEIDYPAFWAWHDHSNASRRAQGCAYATYVGTWRSRFRVLQGSECITRFDEPKTRAKRSFCARCGTPLFYERASAPKWVNIPRALFSGRTGREPRYHLSIQEKVDWAYVGEPLAPLKGYPGVMWARPKRKKSVELPEVL
jgi:hypothetical protein